MTARYFPWFDLAELTTGNMTFSRTALASFNVNVSTLVADDWNGDDSSIASHIGVYGITTYGASGAQRYKAYQADMLANVIQTAVRAGMTANSWPTPSGFTCAFDIATCRYTMTYATGTFGIAWDTALVRALLGYTSDTTTGAATYVATSTPTYCVKCTLLETSPDTEPAYFEPENIGNHVINEEGTGSGVSRGGDAPLYANFRQEYETKEKTLRPYADTSDPWTLQHLFEHCRGEWPFFVYTDTPRIDAYSFRTEGIPFRPRRASPGNDAQFHVPFECVLEGYGNLYLA